MLPGMLKHITSTSEPGSLTSAAALPIAQKNVYIHLTDNPHTHTYGSAGSSSSCSSSAETRRPMSMSEAGQGAGQRSLYSTSGEQADSSSGNRKTGRPRKHH